MHQLVAEIACLYFCASSRGTLSWKRLECQDALREVVLACMSAICALLAFGFGQDPAYNFLVETRVLPFCSSHWSHK